MAESPNYKSTKFRPRPCVVDDEDLLGDAGPWRFHGAAGVVGSDDFVDALAHCEERGVGGGSGGGGVGQTSPVGGHGRGEGAAAAN